MAKISYIISIYNNEKFLKDFFESLKKLKGSFRKEFIIINDASTDNSLKLIKEYSKFLPNSTIISHAKGPQFAVTDAIYISQGEYIQFLEPDAIIDPDNSIDLLNSVIKNNTKLAFGMKGFYNSETKDYIISNKKFDDAVITNPLKGLFANKNNPLSQLSLSSSIISRDVFGKKFSNYKNMCANDLSILLKCASRSDFSFFSKTICYKSQESQSLDNQRNNIINKLISINRFIDSEPDICEKLKKDIYKYTVSNIFDLNRKNIFNISSYVKSKIYTPNISLSELKIFIVNKIINLSKKI